MGQALGEVFTRSWVVDLMLDLAGYTADLPLHELTVVEPSVGSGAFITRILDRLLAAKPADLPWESLSDSVRGFELQPDHVRSCRALIRARLELAGCPNGTAERLAEVWVQNADFLLSGGVGLLGVPTVEADLVIGNPPYIRIEDIDPTLLAQYRAACPTMIGRADIFIGFFERGLDLLKPGGRLAFICADRWMRNSYGKGLRGLIANGGFAVDETITMHDSPAFESEVSAYPAITVVRRGRPGVTVNATATSGFDGESVELFQSWLRSDAAELETPTIQATRSPQRLADDSPWPQGEPADLAWLAEIQRAFGPLETPRTHIAIGLATGADKVYLPTETPDVEREQLIPWVMPRDVQGTEFQWSGRHLVSPWNEDGPVSLAEYPKLARYFGHHRVTLSGRNVAKRSSAWHRTIDRLNSTLLEHDMLVLQDMKAHAHPVRVPAGYYPHHNLTAITSSEWDLDVLGGLLMSDSFERQVAAYCVKMRGGTLRFQPTVLRRVVVPRPGAIRDDVAARLRDAFRKKDRAEANAAAALAFTLPRE